MHGSTKQGFDCCKGRLSFQLLKVGFMETKIVSQDCKLLKYHMSLEQSLKQVVFYHFEAVKTLEPFFSYLPG